VLLRDSFVTFPHFQQFPPLLISSLGSLPQSRPRRFESNESSLRSSAFLYFSLYRFSGYLSSSLLTCRSINLILSSRAKSRIKTELWALRVLPASKHPESDVYFLLSDIWTLASTSREDQKREKERERDTRSSISRACYNRTPIRFFLIRRATRNNDR